MPLHIETPLIESIPLGCVTGRKVLLKLECVQPAGSFKIRGVGALCEKLYCEGKRIFVCASSSNAGYATAYAARLLGAKSVIVAPEGSPEEALCAIRTLGAEVIVHGAVWYDANDLALEMVKQDPEKAYVSSYEDPVLWSGHATMIDELAKQCVKPDVIVCSVGGGGLICGVLEGLDRNGWSDVAVIGCGAYGANAFAASMEAGKLTRIPATTSIITCISAQIVTGRVMELLKTHDLRAYLTSDICAVEACARFLDDHRLLVDPSCGVSLAALYENTPLFGDAKTIVSIVCGGVGIKMAKLRKMRRLAEEERDLAEGRGYAIVD